MASCPKCGKAKIAKGKDGRRKCPRHGPLGQQAATLTPETTITSVVLSSQQPETQGPTP